VSDDDNEDLGCLRPVKLYPGHARSPLAWPGEEPWRALGYGGVFGEVDVLDGHRVTHVANCTPPAVDLAPQRQLWVRFELGPGRHRLPLGVARSFCVVDTETNQIVSGVAPLSSRDPRYPNARPHPALLPRAELSRGGHRRALR
jgi:hypothetical protein